MARAVLPEETVFWTHVRSGRFRVAEASNRWRLVSVDWPFAVFAIRASDGREFGFRFECSNYPRTPATACPWDLDLNAKLASEQWPSGSERIQLAFNPSWKDDCIYLPCDRNAIAGHENWRRQHPNLTWDPDLGIVHYLRILHDLLNSGAYEGQRRDQSQS